MRGMLKRIIKLQVRRRRRFRAPRGVCVVMGGAAGSGKNQIYDIGMGGLSFYYVDDGDNTVPRNRHVLTVTLAGRPWVAQIPCRTVSETDAGELLFFNQRVKRRCVTFERLSARQRAQIRDLIKKHIAGGGS